MTKSEGRKEEERRLAAEANSSEYQNSPQQMNLEKRDTLNFQGDELEKLNTKKINMDIIRQKRENRNSDQVEIEHMGRNLDMQTF